MALVDEERLEEWGTHTPESDHRRKWAIRTPDPKEPWEWNTGTREPDEVEEPWSWDFDLTEPDESKPDEPVRLRLILTRFWPYAARRPGWLFLALLLALIPPALETVGIWLFMVLVDDVLIPRNFDLFPVVAGGFLAMTVVAAIFGGTSRILTTWLSQRFLTDLRVDLLRHLHKQSVDFFQRSRVGDLMARLTGDVAAIEDFIMFAMLGMVTTVLELVFFLGAIFYLQWKLALIALVVTPVFWLISRAVANRLKRLSRERQELGGEAATVVEQGLSNMALVQAYDQGDRQIQRFKSVMERKYRVEMSSAKLESVYEPAAEMVELLGVLLVVGAGAWLLSQGEFTVGGLLAFLGFLRSLYSPTRRLFDIVNSAYTASAGAERVVEILDERSPVQERPYARNIGPASKLNVQGVSFTYGQSTSPTLQDISFDVGRGETVALVGASGAGKSTLAKLLLRFYDPDSGRILLDGQSIRDVSLSSLRRNISVVLQETLVFDATVRENISYGSDGATEADIEAAARAAGAHDFILRLSDGYDTRVGERGRMLSGGQCQRIAIARAMLRDAPFLLLDEPTTGLDANSVDNLIEPLRRLMAGRSTIIISHNLLTVRQADEIIVLDHGRVVERGRHEELLRLQGHYANLCRLSGMENAEGAFLARLPDAAHGTANGNGPVNGVEHSQPSRRKPNPASQGELRPATSEQAKLTI